LIQYLLTLIVRPDLGFPPIDTSYLLDFVDDINTPKEEDLQTHIALAMQEAMMHARRVVKNTTPRWGDLFKETYGPLQFERFGATRTLGCMEEKDHYLFSGSNASGGKSKYRTLYKVVMELGPDGIQGHTIVARNQGRASVDSPHFFDQGELYQQKRMKRSLYRCDDIIENEDSNTVIGIH